MSDNLKTVQEIYACFMQGDVPGILEKLADDVTFYNGADPKVAPFGGTFHGKDGVVQFFQGLGATSQTTFFEASNYREENGKVLNAVQHDGIITSTGKPFSVKALFTWSFNEKGEAIDWKGTGDFSSINNAFLN
ncbi:MAG: nuclear transport factor 2 family protein [Sphingobacteriales bacterium]|nr:MAG: nuclear transport factor 2 family protein [Sphingobacteriales bacterium]